MAITEKLIEEAGEWGIRSLMNDSTFYLSGYPKKIYTSDQASRYISTPSAEVGKVEPLLDHLDTEGELTMLRLSICQMVARCIDDLELIGVEEVGTDVDLDWLYIVDNEDALFVVMIIERFIDHQNKVHTHNMSNPTKIELRDWDILKQIHDSLLDRVETFVNRTPYQPVTAGITSEDEVENLLLSGPDVSNEEGSSLHRRRFIRYTNSAYDSMEDLDLLGADITEPDIINSMSNW